MVRLCLLRSTLNPKWGRNAVGPQNVKQFSPRQILSAFSSTVTNVFRGESGKKIDKKMQHGGADPKWSADGKGAIVIVRTPSIGQRFKRRNCSGQPRMNANTRE